MSALLDAEARQLGVASPFTAIQVREAMDILEDLGFEPSEIVDRIQPIIDAAALNGVTPSTVASDILVHSTPGS